MPAETPVVLLIFNRPDLTERVFEEVRRGRPRTLLVVADGPRPNRPADQELCRATRAIVERIDWPCDLIRNYSDTNLGLRARIPSGLTWAFQHVEEAIVLEDDCLPHPSFFHYCAELLDRYRHDARVLGVSGDNYQRVRRGPASYYFSKYVTCWGWAAWRRSWALFDLSMSLWPAFRDAGGLRSVCPDRAEHDYWFSIFEAMREGKVNSWAYAWVFTGFAHAALSPHPNCNLISNLGFRSDGTHTLADHPLGNLPTQDVGPITHPEFMFADRAADHWEFDYCHAGGCLKLTHRLRLLPERACQLGRGLWNRLRRRSASEIRP